MKVLTIRKYYTYVLPECGIEVLDITQYYRVEGSFLPLPLLCSETRGVLLGVASKSRSPCYSKIGAV